MYLFSPLALAVCAGMHGVTRALLSQVGPVFPFVLQIIPWVLILIGGLANKMSPGFVQPKGVLGSLFHKRLVTCSESIKHSSM